MNLSIGPAKRNEIPQIIALAHELAAWVKAKGEPHWGPNELREELFQELADKGALIAGHIGDTLATCMFLQESDPIFWPHDPLGEALYVHRLGIARKFAGRGYAIAMLDWAAQQARERGRRFVRLDSAPRPKLLAVYASAGFVPVDSEPVYITGFWVIRQQRLA